MTHKYTAAQMRAELLKYGAEQILPHAVREALDGNDEILKILLTKMLPVVRISEDPTNVSLTAEKATDRIDEVIMSCVKGEMQIDHAEKLIKMLAANGELKNVEEMIARLDSIQNQSPDENFKMLKTNEQWPDDLSFLN